MEFSGVTNGTTHHILRTSAVSSASDEHHIAPAGPGASEYYRPEVHASDRSISLQGQVSRLYALHHLPVSFAHHAEGEEFHPAAGRPGTRNWIPNPAWQGTRALVGIPGPDLPDEIKRAIRILRSHPSGSPHIPTTLQTRWNIHLTWEQVSQVIDALDR